EPGKRVPARIEEHEHGPDAMFGRNGQEGVDSVPEACRILLPEQVVEKHPHGIHAQALGPAQFLVDLLRIESVRLPHFKLVDCAGRNKIAAHQPGLLLIPTVGFFLGPARRDSKPQARECKNEHQDCATRSFHGRLPHAAGVSIFHPPLNVTNARIILQSSIPAQDGTNAITPRRNQFLPRKRIVRHRSGRLQFWVWFDSFMIASAALPATTQLADPATTASSSNHRNPKSSMHSGKSGLMMMYPGITAPGI